MPRCGTLLLAADPLHAEPAEYERLARRVLDFRDKDHGGVIRDHGRSEGRGCRRRWWNALKQYFYTSDFGVRSADIVGPQVGGQLKKQATLAVLFSLVAMLVYLWFRFEMIYGRGRGGGGFSRYFNHRWRVLLDESGDNPYCYRRDSNTCWLLHERHHRGV